MIRLTYALYLILRRYLKEDSSRLNFEDMIQLKETKEEKALKLKLKPLPEELNMHILEISKPSNGDFFLTYK